MISDQSRILGFSLFLFFFFFQVCGIILLKQFMENAIPIFLHHIVFLSNPFFLLLIVLAVLKLSHQSSGCQTPQGPQFGLELWRSLQAGSSPGHQGCSSGHCGGDSNSKASYVGGNGSVSSMGSASFGKGLREASPVVMASCAHH